MSLIASPIIDARELRPFRRKAAKNYSPVDEVPYASSSRSTTYLTCVGDPTRRNAFSICMAQPGLPVATTSAPVEATLLAFLVPSRSDISF